MKTARPRQSISKNIDAVKILKSVLSGDKKVREEILLQATAIHFLAPKLKNQIS